MSYVPDFADIVWILGLFAFSGGVLYITPYVDDDWKYCDREWLWMLWFVTGLIGSLGFYSVMDNAEPVPKLCWLILAGYLVICSVMDSMLCQVNDFVQYFGVVGGVIFVLYGQPEPEVGIYLILFGLLQYFLFMKMYGKADGMAFQICALYQAGMGRGMEAYLFHMIFCYLLLAVIQGFKKNINEKGNLKEPVALLPYISAGFLFLIQSADILRRI